MDERQQQQQQQQQARDEAWIDDSLWREDDENGGPGPGPGFSWMGPWGPRRRPPVQSYDAYEASPRHRRREYTSGWWVLFWIFIAIIVLAMLTPSVGGGMMAVGSSFTAILGLVILFLAIWKVIDLIRYR